ncbi:glycosyl hydrolase family 28-related protein [Rathayibacter sp. CAU 1779]
MSSPVSRRAFAALTLAGAGAAAGEIVHPWDAAHAATRSDASVERVSAKKPKVVKDYVSVKDYGAKGDGSTDDTAAVQAALDSGAGMIFFPAGIYPVTAVRVLTASQRLLGAGPQVSWLVRIVASSGGRSGTEYSISAGGFPVLEVAANGVRMEALSIKAMTAAGTFPAHDGKFDDCGIRAARPVTPGAPAKGVGWGANSSTYYGSVDVDIRNCYVSGFYTGIIMYGQGFTAIGNMITLSEIGIDLDFPTDWKDVGDKNQYGWYSGFRTYRIENTRMQANSGPLVRNTGPHAAFIRTVNIDGVVGDIGDQIFEGCLCRGSIRNFISADGIQTPVIQLNEGSVDWEITGGIISGRLATTDPAVAASMPDQGILITGEVSHGSIKDVRFINLNQEAIRFEGPAHDIRIDDCHFENVGLDHSGTYRAITFTDADIQVGLSNIAIYSSGTETAAPLYFGSGGTATDVRGENVYRVAGDANGGLYGIKQGVWINQRATAAPTQGTWVNGAVLWKANASSGDPMGWICTAAGSPGSWAPLAPVQ